MDLFKTRGRDWVVELAARLNALRSNSIGILRAQIHLNLAFIITILLVLVYDSDDMISDGRMWRIFELAFYLLYCDGHLNLSVMYAWFFIDDWRQALRRYFLRILGQIAILVNSSRWFLLDWCLGFGCFKDQVWVVCLRQLLLKISHVLEVVVTYHDPFTIGEENGLH